MTAEKPVMAVRTGTDSAAAEGSPPESTGDVREPILDEILGTLRVIEARSGEDRAAGPSEESIGRLAGGVETLGKNVEEARSLLDRLARQGQEISAAAEGAADLAKEIRSQRADFGRWLQAWQRGRRRWAALGIAMAVPASLLLGVLVEKEFEVFPRHDPTGGWRGHIWEQYGRRIVDCAVEARRTGARVSCPLVVRAP